MTMDREHEVLVEVRRDRDRLDAQVRELTGRRDDLLRELADRTAERDQQKGRAERSEAKHEMLVRELVTRGRRLHAEWLSDEAREDENPQPLDDEILSFIGFIETESGETVKAVRE